MSGGIIDPNQQKPSQSQTNPVKMLTVSEVSFELTHLNVAAFTPAPKVSIEKSRDKFLLISHHVFMFFPNQLRQSFEVFS